VVFFEATQVRALASRVLAVLFLSFLFPLSIQQSAVATSVSPDLKFEGAYLNRYGSGEYWYQSPGASEFSDSLTVNSGRGGLTKTLTPAAGALFGGKATGDSATGTIGPTTSLDTVTVEVWLKLSDNGSVENASGSMIFSWNPGSGVSNYNIYHTQGKIGFNTFNSDLYGLDSTSLEDNQWNHFVFVMTDSGAKTNQKIYVNGVEQNLSCLINLAGTGCDSTRSFSSSGNFLIMDNARNVGTWNAKGTIGQIKIYKQGLTAANALANFRTETRQSSTYITGFGTSSDVSVSKSAVLSDSATVLNTALSSDDSMTIYGFDTQTIRITVSTDTGTVNIATSTGLSKATGSGYANAGSNAITTPGTTIAFEGNPTDVQAALDTLRLNLPTARTSSFSGAATVTVSVSYVGGSTTAFNSDNQHFYRYFAPVGSGSMWQEVMDLTTASGDCGVTFNGLCGYLATVTSETETAFIKDKVTTANVWIGGNDTATEGTWRWPYNSPEAGAIFFKDSENNPGTENIDY
jgi:hypothetical protein